MIIFDEDCGAESDFFFFLIPKGLLPFSEPQLIPAANILVLAFSRPVSSPVAKIHIDQSELHLTRTARDEKKSCLFRSAKGGTSMTDFFNKV